MTGGLFVWRRVVVRRRLHKNMYGGGEMLDTGRVKNMTELAKAEKVGLARMQKMLKLARLAPDIVDEIARGRQPGSLRCCSSSKTGCRMTGMRSGM